jgi:ABC-2 type transport system permease protein
MSIFFVAFYGLNFGIDFTGGTLLEVGYEQPIELSEVRNALAEAGFSGAVVQRFGTTRDILIRLAPGEGRDSAKLSNEVLAALRAASANEVTMRRVEFVGPKVGEELAEQGGLAMLYALIGILIYVSLRFEYRLAVGSVVALIHDVLIVLGIFSLLQFVFDLTVLAALYGNTLATLPLLICSILLTWGAMSAMGFFLSSHMLHMRNATQIISFVNVILAVIPPVYYSIERLPSYLQYLAYSVPTTHASLMIQDSMGLATPESWSLFLGLAVQSAYLLFFLFLAKARAVWRDL